MTFRFLFGLAIVLISQTTPVSGATVTAVSGQPYGVAVIEIPLAASVIDQTLPPLCAINADGRVLYPVSEDIRVQVPPPSERPVPRPGRGRLLGRLGNLIREITSDDKPQTQTVARRVTFLFRGDNPMTVTLTDAQVSNAQTLNPRAALPQQASGVSSNLGTFELRPQTNPALHAETLGRWWAGYIAAAKKQMDTGDYPPWVENYLIAMLSGRMKLPLPDWYLNTAKEDDELLSTLKLLAGSEGVGEAIFRKQAAGMNAVSQAADQPLPAPPTWNPPYERDDLNTVPVEPIATRVPPECFYIRYGSFENYLWFLNLTEEYGGDLSAMVTLHGLKNESSARVEKQLNLKTTAMSRLLGPTVIEDQAIIGRDLFLNDGASIGVLFKSKNAFLFRTSLNNDRSQLANSDDAVSLNEITIAGRTATFLSSADNRVRSFLVEDDGYFLVTNSRTIAERFIQVGQSKASLAATSSFLLARQLMPLERQDTIFAYLSPDMQRGLVSPKYLIELRRRLSANAEISLTHLARLAFRQEQPPTAIAQTSTQTLAGIVELIQAGFLPDGFGTRPDGSGTVEVGSRVMDTRRGNRGTFLPVADVTIDAVTAEESAWYQRIAAEYSARFPTFDPIMLGLARLPGDDNSGVGAGIERVQVHAEIAPWGSEKYGKWSRQLGPPTPVAMKFAPDDIISLQAHVASDQLGPPTHLFAAIKDTVPPRPEDFQGILNIYRSLKSVPGYLGAWPQPGALDRLPLGLGVGTPVGPGMNRLIGGLFRFSDGSFSILSFWPDLLQASLPYLEAIDVPDRAQVRANFGNIRGTQLETWVNNLLYERARESSVAGASFLSLLSRQLGVASEQSKEAAKTILGSQLQCALGGDYQYAPARGRWNSTQWQSDVPSVAAPPGYVAPTMKWFRGGTASLTQYQDRIVVDAQIDVARDR